MTVEELNAASADGSINELIRVAEARQRKILSHVADDICSRSGVRVVLLAGASSAGKTTTATRLCTQLRVNDATALHFSTDDYFVGDARNPRDENGEFDYEHIDCVDVPRLTADLKALMRGETIPQRRFDFVRHEGYDSEVRLRIPSDGYIVIEGIHALNPRLTEGVAEACKYRVFIEPKPSLDLFAGLCPRGQDARLMRRLVRDNQFRKTSPSATIQMWPKVLAGEEKWINPFRDQANATFDSYLVYEMGVLKHYLGGLLAYAQREMGDHPDVIRLMRMLEPVIPISADIVPGDSILRETIGGSQLEY